MVQIKRILFSVGLGIATLLIIIQIISPFKFDFKFTGLFTGNKTSNKTESLLESLKQPSGETTTSTTTVITTTSTSTITVLTTTKPATTTLITTTTPVTTTIPKQGNIVINEIMYDPPGSDPGSEWIEIYNEDDYDVNISCWKFFEGDTNHVLTFEGSTIILSESYAVISNDGDNFLAKYPDHDGIVIDSTFSLSNNGEYIALKDCDLNVVDEITFNSSLGGNGNNKTIEKYVDGWGESQSYGGTPGSENIILTSTTTTTTTTSSTTSTTTSTTTTTTIHIGPYINQIEPIEEWVKIISNSETNMTNWILYDNNSTHVYSFPKDFLLLGNVKVHTEHGVDNSTDLYWNQTNVWNNDHDVATLKDDKGNIIHQKSY